MSDGSMKGFSESTGQSKWIDFWDLFVPTSRKHLYSPPSLFFWLLAVSKGLKIIEICFTYNLPVFLTIINNQVLFMFTNIHLY